MCNLYTLRLSAAELAEHFGTAASKAGEKVYPGAPGLVFWEDGGRRVMLSMIWAFRCGSIL
ncbi:hypothetical protein [Sphingomonas sp. BAUL-RG-20F-R05-02]|uniref:hypothetical protein n=1 Tax=Sphingomonas sp. BAUL-RG-20F-R05-02 TaxID=2914830 RepID=UPI001F5852CB|nr:hypothetical protein [Sphingomonas sp. BAUL-RG-20F-R05-02]